MVLQRIGFLGALLALAACAQGAGKPQAVARPSGGEGDSPATVLTAAPPPPRTAVTAEQFDTTTTEQRKAAAAAPPEPGERRLGTTIASLGDATDQGFWAETGLVSKLTVGRLEYPGTGKSVKVELRPSGGDPGSGTRVSLPAMRVLEAPLTDLPELVVYGG